MVWLFGLTLVTRPDILAQMPDWILVRDADGNRYHVDYNGKIYTSGRPEFDSRPVSAPQSRFITTMVLNCSGEGIRSRA